MEWLVRRKSFFAKKTDGTWQQQDMRLEYEAARQLLRGETVTLRDDLHTVLGA